MAVADARRDRPTRPVRAAVGQSVHQLHETIGAATPTTRSLEDELSEEDKILVGRARRLQRFLSQPFHVAEVFTGMDGIFVPVEETVESFEQLVNGVTLRKGVADLEVTFRDGEPTGARPGGLIRGAR